MHVLHGIYQGCLALEAVGSILADLVKEVVEWRAEKQNLQNLAHVSSRFWSISRTHQLTEFM